jgi:DNA-binding transcriptional MocR family regulator
MKKYEHVINIINELIGSKVLKEKEQLPSIRSMAKQIGVSTTTVTEAYHRLENLGIIESRPQSGYYVRPQRNSTLIFQQPETNQSEILLKPNSVIIPKIVHQLIAQNLRKEVIPLGSGLPESNFFPNEELGKYLARVSRTYNDILNHYHPNSGKKELLDMITLRMLEAGCPIQKDEIIVTNGATQALMLALRTVTKPGDVVAVESPGYYGFYLLLQFFNLNSIEIPCDPQKGIDVNVLRYVLDDGLRPACVLLSSNFSNPTGALVPKENKETLVQICSTYNIPIIEDDTLGELTFNSYRPRPLKALAPNTVLYVNSFSKILSPGFRIGWLAGGRHSDEILQSHGMSVFMIPIATQLALALFLKEGKLKQHLRRLRMQYKNNVKLFQNKVAMSFPQGTRISNPQGGQFLWIELPPGHDAVELSMIALKNGISVAPGVLFSSRYYHKKYIRLNCALNWNDEIEKAIERLGELLA